MEMSKTTVLYFEYANDHIHLPINLFGPIVNGLFIYLFIF